jgi:hypothetical protein
MTGHTLVSATKPQTNYITIKKQIHRDYGKTILKKEILLKTKMKIIL